MDDSIDNIISNHKKEQSKPVPSTSEKNKNIITNTQQEINSVSIPLKEEESEDEENINREVDEMIECAEFVGKLIKQTKNDKKFEHILQEEDKLINKEDILFINKKRDRNILDDSDGEEDQGLDDLLNSDWRSINK